MKTYLTLLRKVLEEGERRENRTGIDTLSLFGERLVMDLQDGFPLLTTKKVWFKGIIGELVWFLHGESNIKFLTENNIHIWDNWADSEGNLGPVYGKQWRDWNGIDQIETIRKQLMDDPYSRRIILSSWNVAQLPAMALPPCHILAQFYVRGEYLDCAVYQRSGDIFLGVPFDIASYAALVHIFAEECGYRPGRLVYNFGDIHLYENHIEAAKEQLSREPRKLPQLHIKSDANFNDLKIADFVLFNYDPQEPIKADVAI